MTHRTSEKFWNHDQQLSKDLLEVEFTVELRPSKTVRKSFGFRSVTTVSMTGFWGDHASFADKPLQVERR